MELSPAPPEAAPRVPRRLIVRFLILVLLVGTGLALLRWSPLGGYLTGEKLSATIEMLRDSWWAPAALIAAFVILCPLGIPASPMVIAGGVIFGVVVGSFYNILGTFLGAVVSYFVGRALGRDFVMHLAGKRLKKVERAIARRGFWGMVGVRFVPLPFALVNYCAALAGVRPGLFLVTTLIGLMPTQIIFTYFADTLSRAATGERAGIYQQLAVAGVLLLLLSLVPQIWTGQQRRKRLRVHRERRRGRTGG